MDRALLKSMTNTHQVSVNGHRYEVDEDGYLFIDVRPFLRAERFVKNPDPYGEERLVPNPLCDPMANAETDATEICRLTAVEEEFNVQRRVRLFEPPTRKERQAWMDQPANFARWEGVSLQEAEARLNPKAAALGDLQPKVDRDALGGAGATGEGSGEVGDPNEGLGTSGVGANVAGTKRSVASAAGAK